MLQSPLTGAPQPATPFTPAKPVEEKALPTVVPQASGSASSEPEKTFLGYSAFTWSKIIPLGLMFFCILFNYTILRDTKVRSHMAHPDTPHSQLCAALPAANSAASSRQLASQAMTAAGCWA